MPLVQPVRDDCERTLEIEHDEVGVAPGRDPPFVGEPREPGGSFGAPASEIAQIPAAVACPGPRGGEPHLERRDAAPRPHEISRVEAFELGGRGRMVARHQVERPVGEALPQTRSEEHTSELQSQSNLVCRLLLEKKKHYPRYHVSYA